jgi:putative ABC transport system substrate-binding protein
MLTAILTLSLFAGCGAKADDGIIKVAIIQQLDHSSLDEIRNAAEAELDKIAAEKGLTLEYKHFNGQNDTSILSQIGTQVVSDGYDLIIPIATLAAQYAVTAAEGYDCPLEPDLVAEPAAV